MSKGRDRLRGDSESILRSKGIGEGLGVYGVEQGGGWGILGAIGG